MKTSIHQPNYLPYLGFFNKIKNSDLFIIFDIADYTKNSICNRNKIRTVQGWTYLTIPIEKSYHQRPFYKVMLPKNNIWQKKHWRSIEINYSKAPFFNSYKDFFEKLYKKNFRTLQNINEEIILFLLKEFKINTQIKRTTELKINTELKKTDLLLDILTKTNASSYLSGLGAKDYLEIKKFKNINLEFQEFRHPIYKQVYKPFIPNLSAIDLIFNIGEKSTNLL